MATTTIKFKRTSVPGRAPSLSDLTLGEMAINTNSGKLYTKIDDGTTVKITEVGAGIVYTAGTGISISTNNVISSQVVAAGPATSIQTSNGSGGLTAIAVGADGQVLTTVGTTPTWRTPTPSVTSVNTSGGTTGMTFTGGPITSSGTMVMSGTLAIANGGTGQTTAANAINALLPSQSAGTNGQVLTSNGTTASWAATNAGTVTSVAVAGGTTGMTFSGGPVTTSGTMTMGGVLAIANGGSGATTTAGFQAAALPAQTGNSGRYLTTNGTAASWAVVPTGTVTSVAGSGGTTGLTLTGGPITSSGTLTLGGTLAIANGGSGATTSAGFQAAALPAQTGNSGKVLSTNGTAASWIDAATGSVSSVDASGGTTGLTFTGGPITSSGTLTLSGTLAIANGGTGQTTAANAINALLPSQASQSGRFLTTNGTVASWAVAPAGTVTSVAASGGTTGLSFTGSPITTSGTVTLSGTLAITNGGTGQTTLAGFQAAALPTQTGNSGKVLTTDGTVASWTTAAATGVTSVAASGGTTGLTFTGSPITSTGTLTLDGTLAIANGGTGQTTLAGFQAAALPTQTGNSGRYLTTNGTVASWATVTSGTVTSVGVSGGTTGLTTTGGPVTGSGTITLAGTLAIANGGTGQTTAANAINALLPTQTSQTGRYLTTNGTVASWADVPTGTPGGATTQVQFNSSGSFAGDAGLTYTVGSSTLAATNINSSGTSTLGSVDTNSRTTGNVTDVAGSTINTSVGNYFRKTATGALTWTFTNPPAAGRAHIFALTLTNGGLGTQTWPSTVRWPNGAAPVLSSAATDLLLFETDNGGTIWRGAALIGYATT